MIGLFANFHFLEIDQITYVDIKPGKVKVIQALGADILFCNIIITLHSLKLVNHMAWNLRKRLQLLAKGLGSTLS